MGRVERMGDDDPGGGPAIRNDAAPQQCGRAAVDDRRRRELCIDLDEEPPLERLVRRRVLLNEISALEGGREFALNQELALAPVAEFRELCQGGGHELPQPALSTGG